MAAISWRLVSAGLDSLTAVFAALNWLYFTQRLMAGGERPPSRIAAISTLSLLSLATFVEAVALLAIAESGEEPGPLSSGAWTAVRVLPFAGTAAISVLIARRLAAR